MDTMLVAVLALAWRRATHAPTDTLLVAWAGARLVFTLALPAQVLEDGLPLANWPREAIPPLVQTPCAISIACQIY